MTDKKVLKEFEIDEISVVDNPAQPMARIALMKRQEQPIEKNRRGITTMSAGHAHSFVLLTGEGEIKAGTTSYSIDAATGVSHTHDFVVDDAGNVIFADSAGHNHGVAVLVKNEDTDLVELVEKVGDYEDEDEDSNNKAEKTIGDKEPNMTDQQHQAAEEQVAKADYDAAIARAERAEAIAGLSKADRKTFDELDDDGKEEFMRGDSDKREKMAKALTDADPVVHTDLDGNEYRKSAGEALVRLARQNDELRKSQAAAEAIAKKADLERRGGETFGNLPGETVVKGALLGAIEGIKDETLRGQVLDAVRSHDAGLGKAFERVGTAEGGSSGGGSPSAQLDELAKAYADKKGIPFGKAYNEVLDSPEGRALYTQHVGQ